ncbi:coproporphyrinogen III oxidase [Planctomycetes bacterium Pan216]|uniref:Coproporphyrinogen III oxidase n=1 Tax=Kolteria novifilia TaxID=2527975 RepID=A0A518B2Z9_9BACT|nr:coproporphyrinogen III oxidase [Planctomycetes bacterium Pan216]
MSQSVGEEVVEAPPRGWREAGLRYYKYNQFLRERFGARIFRVTVDGGFTCPNVDGKVALGGCVYCDNRSFSPTRRLPRVPLHQQIDRGIAMLEDRYGPDGYFAYFQAATNTYASLDKLKRLYDEVVAHPRIQGLVIGTRPDCVADPVLDLIESYAKRMYVSLEYGLQTVHQRSLDWMNRGHDVACYYDAVERTRGRGIDICAHVILGLPGESFDDMMQTAEGLVASNVDAVKIHNLHVVGDTPMEEQFQRGEIAILDRSEYMEVLIAFLERLPETMVVQRVTGDAPDNYLVAPAWVEKKASFLQELDREFQRRDTWQGKLVRPSPVRKS